MPFYAIILSFLVGDLIYWCWADRRLQSLRWSAFLRGLLASFFCAQLLYLAYFFLLPRSSRRSHEFVPVPVLSAFYLWHLLILPPTTLALLLGGFFTTAWRWLASRTSRTPVSAGTSLNEPTRRQVLAATIAITPPLLAGGLVGRAMGQLSDFRIRRMDLSIASLPPNLDGLTIAHVTDIHTGRFTRPGQLQRIVQATNQLRADLVFMTGDLIDVSLEDLDRALAAVQKMESRFGTFMVEGNHDLIEDPQEFDTRTRASGVPFLVDEAVTVPIRGERLQLLGIRWGRPFGEHRGGSDAAIAESMARVLPLREPGAFPILLAHHPHAFDPAAEADLPLTLAGHTHGGLFMLNEKLGAGPAMFRYWSGLYQKPNGSQLVVSNGVGNWFPLRINAPAEIIHLTLHRA